MLYSFVALRKFLRDDSVISVKLCSSSFLSFFSYYLQNKFYLLEIYINLINVLKNLGLMTFELHNNTHYCFFLDPLKPHFNYISTGLRGSVLHGDFSLMVLCIVILLILTDLLIGDTPCQFF